MIYLADEHTIEANLGLLHRADKRRADRLGQSIEAHHALAGAECGPRFGNLAESGVDVLPVVTHPHVAGGINGHVGDHLDAAALEKVDGIASPVGEKARMRASGINSASDFSFETTCKEL